MVGWYLAMRGRCTYCTPYGGCRYLKIDKGGRLPCAENTFVGTIDLTVIYQRYSVIK